MSDMKTIRDLLGTRTEAVAERWIRSALEAYPPDTASFLQRERDPFANPVGNAIRTGLPAVWNGLLEDADEERIARPLDDILRIRAVQESTPAAALAFVFKLKEAVRAELGPATRDPRIQDELAGFDARIDRLALTAFALYLRHREQVFELRVNEVKRNVSAILDQAARRWGDAPAGDPRRNDTSLDV
jgi:hypothetical protein